MPTNGSKRVNKVKMKIGTSVPIFCFASRQAFETHLEIVNMNIKETAS